MTYSYAGPNTKYQREIYKGPKSQKGPKRNKNRHKTPGTQTKTTTHATEVHHPRANTAQHLLPPYQSLPPSSPILVDFHHHLVKGGVREGDGGGLHLSERWWERSIYLI